MSGRKFGGQLEHSSQFVPSVKAASSPHAGADLTVKGETSGTNDAVDGSGGRNLGSRLVGGDR